MELACTISDSGDFLEAQGFKVYPLNIARRLAPYEDLKAYKRIKEIIRRGDYDLVHTHNPKDGVLGRMAAWELGVPAVVHTCNGFYFSDESGWLRKRLVLMAEGYASRRCHCLIFVNSEDMYLAIKRGMVGEKLVKFLPNGVDTERFKPGEDPALKEEWGIPPQAPVVGYVGEITREKNITALIQAFALLRRRHPQLWLVVVGDALKRPEEMTKCKNMLADLHLEKFTVMAGYRRDVERCYRVMNVYAHPSLREGFGVSVIEAMASGVPVVANRIRGPREIVKDGITGTLVKPGDYQEMAEAIAFYLEEPEAVERHTSQALEEVRKNYRLKERDNRLHSIYRKLTAERRD